MHRPLMFWSHQLSRGKRECDDMSSGLTVNMTKTNVYATKTTDKYGYEKSQMDDIDLLFIKYCLAQCNI